MITITILNTKEVVEAKKGWFVAKVVGGLIDLEPKVEEVVMAKLKEALAEQGIEAHIERQD